MLVKITRKDFMKKAISITLLFLCLAALASAQTKTKNELLQNTAGNQVTLGAPVAVTNNTILFPGTLGLQGSMLYMNSVAGAVGSTTWLNPGTNGFILSLSGGLPIWSDPAVILGASYWSLAGNAPAAGYNGTTGSFLGTTNTQPMVLATTNTTTPQPIEFFSNNVERARIASTGQLLVATTTPQATVTVNGETYSNTFLPQVNTAKPAWQEGRFFYDTAEKTMAYYNDHNGVTLNVGQEEWVRVYNATGSSIANGSAVYINGSNAASGLPTVALAKADQLLTVDVIGIATETIPNNSLGYVTAFGVVHQQNTSSYSAGQVLYLSATTAGSLTATRPGQPNFTNPIGYVDYVDASLGKILVNLGKSRQGAMTPGAIAFGGMDGYIRESPQKFFFDSVNQRLGIGTNAPGTAIDLTGDISIRYHGITLSADSTDNLAVGAYSYVGITGRTNNYIITGISGGVDGKQIQIINLTPKTMTLYHQNAGSTSANRIYNPSGQNISIADSGTVGLVYNSLLNCWVVQSTASAMSGTGNFTIVRQKSDQSITNSTTFKTATDFNYNVKPNSVYEVEIVVFDSGVGGSYMTGIASVPTGTTITGEVTTFVNGHLAPDVDIIRNGNFSSGGGTNTMTGVAGYIISKAILTTETTAGVVTFTWGMLSSGAGKTVWLFKDSYAIIRLIGKI